MATKEYLLNRRQEHKKWATELLGGKCVYCGTTEKLEFDHINPENVGFRIGERLLSSKETLRKELKKCQLLCKDCHWVKTRFDRGLNGKAHGTANMYINYKCRCPECKSAWAKYYGMKVGYRVRPLRQIEQN